MQSKVLRVSWTSNISQIISSMNIATEQTDELGYSISYKTTYASREGSNQPVHPCSLIRVRRHGYKAFSGGQRIFWSACAHEQADLNLRWAHIQSCRKRCPGSDDMYKSTSNNNKQSHMRSTWVNCASRGVDTLHRHFHDFLCALLYTSPLLG